MPKTFSIPDEPPTKKDNIHPPPQSSNIEHPTRQNTASISPTSSRGINNTLLRHWTLLAALETLGRFQPNVGCVVMLTKNLCVKHGSLVQLSEASTLRYVRARTSIPVPEVHCAFAHKDMGYILMERIHGKMVYYGWGMRSAESKGKILDQLKTMVDELRSLPPPSPRISNVDGGPVYDCRFPGTSLTIGPFDTIHDFHRFLRNGLEGDPRMPPELNRMIMLQDRPWPMPVFTHGDLSSLNILVCGDNVVGIIDWETSGWYPSYWEFSMTWYYGNPRNMFWREEVSSGCYARGCGDGADAGEVLWRAIDAVRHLQRLRP